MKRRAALALALVSAAGAPLTSGPAGIAARLAAQQPTMPSTLRYGSGLMDIPVSSVLPHLTITGTLSGHRIQLGRRVLIDDAGQPAGYGPGRDDVLADGSVAVGLYDWGEAGFTVQTLNDADEGGNIWGVFGRLRLWEPVDQGVGLAVGGRYVTSPSFADGASYASGRLGFADDRLRTSYTSVRGLDTDLSLYVVATAFLRGFDGGPLPENDMTFTLGYGGGMFGEGGGLDFYSGGNGGGWFGGTSLHVATGERSQLTLMAEHNGFDVNVGAHFEHSGARVGVQYLAANHHYPMDGHTSEYLKPKWGLLASFAICPGGDGILCRPRGMRRAEPDTIYIPPPPPDTIVVDTGVRPRVTNEGVPASVCLSTGQNVPIRITSAGDTLVGPEQLPLRDLGPGIVFAGTYAGNAFWYQDDEVIVFEGGDFGKSDDTFPVDCSQILRVGVYEGVPVFAVISASRPLDVIFIPVRPGVWHRYERGLRRSPDAEQGRS